MTLDVVVIDDNITIRNMMDEYLESYHVNSRVTGDTTYALTMKADLYLIDYNLGENEMNGNEVSEALKELYPDALRISFSSNYEVYQNNSELYDNYLSKPFQTFELDALIEFAKSINE